MDASSVAPADGDRDTQSAQRRACVRRRGDQHSPDRPSRRRDLRAGGHGARPHRSALGAPQERGSSSQAARSHIPPCTSWRTAAGASSVSRAESTRGGMTCSPRPPSTARPSRSTPIPTARMLTMRSSARARGRMRVLSGNRQPHARRDGVHGHRGRPSDSGGRSARACPEFLGSPRAGRLACAQTGPRPHGRHTLPLIRLNL